MRRPSTAQLRAWHESNHDHYDALEIFAEALTKTIGESHQPALPRPNESLALAIHTPKTASLAFDRVYRFPGFSVGMPDEVGFFCGSHLEYGIACSARLIGIAN